MKTNITRTLMTLAASVALCATSFAVDADNTKKNERDKAGENKTPLDQSNSPEDLKLVKTIRQAVMAEKSLTAVAKNVKIITASGQVTLRGPVNSEEEKTKIESLATTAAGEGKVTNQLEVKASK